MMIVDEIDITELVEAVERVKAIYRRPLPHQLDRRGNPSPDNGTSDRTAADGGSRNR